MKLLKIFSIFIGLAFLVSGAAYGATIKVPDDYTTIQEAIDAAVDGDTILVAPGTYGNFNYIGKNITVRSDGDGDPATYDILPNATITGDVVFGNGETEDAVLDGFTCGYFDIRNGSSPTIRNCIEMFRSCSDGCGSQIHGGSPTFINCIFYGNDGGEGAGVKVGPEASSAKFINCTFYGNNAGTGGGLSVNNSCTATLINCIFWGNTASNGNQIAVLNNSTVTVSYSDIQGGQSEVFVDGTSTLNWDSGTNINSDPLFVDAEGEDFHLQHGSPCIDAGTSEGAPNYDIDGDVRPQGAGYDMGADEYVNLAEIIGTWSSGIWYWDVAKSKWTKMYSGLPSAALAAGDFTDDGKADVASIWSSGLWFQNGDTLGWTQVYHTAPDRVAAGDITGDGVDEIIACGGAWGKGVWYRDAANGTWHHPWSGPPDAAMAGDHPLNDTPDGPIAAGDVTGDGKADMVSCWDSGLWYQDGDTLSWTKVWKTAPYKVTCGDVTGDGQAEIISTWSDGFWYWDVAASKWTKMTSYVTNEDIAAGDFNGDGKSDVASIWTSGLWYQNGATLKWKKVCKTAPYTVTAGDVTGD